MSYILDALKRAESERKLGVIPGMHAQPVPAPAAVKVAFWRRPLAWMMGAAIAVVIAATAWVGTQQNRLILTAAAPAAATSAQPESALPGATPEAPQKRMERELPAPPPHIKPLDAPAPLARVQKADSLTVITGTNDLQRKPVDKKTVKAAVAAAATVATPVVPFTAAPPQQAVALPPQAMALPENIRRTLPVVAVGGYIYSDNAAERSIVINNRLRREGDQIAPGLSLEQMMPQEAVLNYRGTRYRIRY